MQSLVLQYPDVEIQGFATQADILDSFGDHIFQVWCAISFTLNKEQFDTGTFSSDSPIVYSIRMNPNVVNMPFSTYDPAVYNDYMASADNWLNSGYLTLQNYIRSYITNTYVGSEANFKATNQQFSLYDFPSKHRCLTFCCIVTTIPPPPSNLIYLG